jgi:hypothetical protein
MAAIRYGSSIVTLALGLALLLGACKGDTPAEKPADPAPAPGEEAKAASAEAAPAAPAANEAKPAAAAPTEKVKAPTDKDTLAKAYVEIYCAQRKKETDRLLEIYTRYGFEDPKSWTASWTTAAKDDAWVAEITQKAIQTCP